MADAVTTIGVISTSVLAALGIFQSYQKIVGKLKNLVSWKVVEDGVEHLLTQMRRDNYYPDAILPMGRGGSVIAGLMSNKFYADKNIPIFMIDRDIRHNDNTRVAVLKSEIADLARAPRKILLVSGINASGTTIEAYKRWAAAKGAQDVKTATLVESHTAKSLAEYCYKRRAVNPNKLKMPWYEKGIIDWQPPKFRDR